MQVTCKSSCKNILLEFLDSSAAGAGGHFPAMKHNQAISLQCDIPWDTNEVIFQQQKQRYMTGTARSVPIKSSYIEKVVHYVLSIVNRKQVHFCLFVHH